MALNRSHLSPHPVVVCQFLHSFFFSQYCVSAIRPDKTSCPYSKRFVPPAWDFVDPSSNPCGGDFPPGALDFSLYFHFSEFSVVSVATLYFWLAKLMDTGCQPMSRSCYWFERTSCNLLFSFSAFFFPPPGLFRLVVFAFRLRLFLSGCLSRGCNLFGPGSYTLFVLCCF